MSRKSCPRCDRVVQEDLSAPVTTKLCSGFRSDACNAFLAGRIHETSELASKGRSLELSWSAREAIEDQGRRLEGRFEPGE